MTTNSNTKLDKKDLMGIFWRSWRQDAVWNFERQQNLGSAYTMSRLVGKLYKDDKGSSSSKTFGLYGYHTSFIHTLIWNISSYGRGECK